MKIMRAYPLTQIIASFSVEVNRFLHFQFRA
nr:MAG TPA: hypothetical protein [Bacteriophage sp.]